MRDINCDSFCVTLMSPSTCQSNALLFSDTVDAGRWSHFQVNLCNTSKDNFVSIFKDYQSVTHQISHVSYTGCLYIPRIDDRVRLHIIVLAKQ